MAKKQHQQRHPVPAPEPSEELQRILCELDSPDDGTRAAAVRQLCPCRGADWGVPIFPRVLALRDDPSPVVRHAVQHDLSENPWWTERQELRRLEGRQAKRETQQAQAAIEAGCAEDELPDPHSLVWRTPRRPRSRKAYYPPRPRRGGSG
jgi:hypothetical protein